jgi:hypothetical protein
MLTIFAVPKPFVGHIGITQRNAVRSWARLGSGSEIILCGDDAGTGEVAAEVGATHIPNVARNEYGTPLLDSIFDHARAAARYPLLCYVNADIMLLSDVISAVQRVEFPQFLIVGQRWDVDITEPWDFGHKEWGAHLRQHVQRSGVLHPPLGSDYFIFPRESPLAHLPRFAVGRPGWDNWLIFHARKLGIPVIDATKAVFIIHQNHDYSHVPNRIANDYRGPECSTNLQLIVDRGDGFDFDLVDATHVITEKIMTEAHGLKHVRRRLWRRLSFFYRTWAWRTSLAWDIVRGEPITRWFAVAKDLWAQRRLSR